MRISDWSSDVCSSDLHHPGCHRILPGNVVEMQPVETAGVGGLALDQFELAEIEQQLAHQVGADREAVALLHHPSVTVPGHGHGAFVARLGARSEEHTSDLQSLMRISYAVYCLK